jgi:hypothetical protein
MSELIMLLTGIFMWYADRGSMGVDGLELTAPW